MALNLAGVQLKKQAPATAASEAESAKKAARRKRCASDDDFFRLMQETNMEEYFDTIKPFTFRSEFFPLTAAKAQALTSAYDRFASCTSSEQRVAFDWMSDPLLLEIAKEIDEAQVKLGCKGLFVRTSSRSPKDAALTEKGVSVYLKALSTLSERAKIHPEPFNTEDNVKLHALYVMGTKALRVENGKEAVDLLVRSNRLQEDLKVFIQHPERLYQICVREFADFEVELEFRGFVWGNKITAITQYNEYVYFPGVVEHKQMLQKLLFDWIQTNLVGKVRLESFVIDLMIVSQTPEQGVYSNPRVFIVEINPFAEFAGTGLFRWEVEKDADVLYGDAPFEFRVVERPQRGLIKSIPEDWQKQLVRAEQELAKKK